MTGGLRVRQGKLIKIKFSTTTVSQGERTDTRVFILNKFLRYNSLASVDAPGLNVTTTGLSIHYANCKLRYS